MKEKMTLSEQFEALGRPIYRKVRKVVPSNEGMTLADRYLSLCDEDMSPSCDEGISLSEGYPQLCLPDGFKIDLDLLDDTLTIRELLQRLGINSYY